VPTSLSPAIEPWLAAALSRFTAAPATPTSALDDLGLDSLSLIRVVLAVLGEDDDIEIDPAGLATLRTVADLQGWLAAIRVTTGDGVTSAAVTS
jgi:acyl carrier protein